MAVLPKNNATSRLASSLTAAATTLSVASGEGAKFPSPSGGDWFPLTIVKASGALEIVKCTARSGDVLTVARAQEGTAAQAFSAGDRVELRVTKALLDEFMQSSLFSEFIKTLIDDPDAATARETLGLGTAATRTAQTSVTDATAAALLIVGAFGLGNSVAAVVAPLATTLTSGFYRYSSTDPDVPEAGAAGPLLVLVNSAAGVTQIAFRNNSPKIWSRYWNGTAWSAWNDVWNSATLPVSDFIKTLLDDASASAALTTLGVSDFIKTLLDDSSAAAARATLGITVADGGIGYSQTWQDVAGSRAANTNYRNTTGRPIMVAIVLSAAGSVVDSVRVSPDASNWITVGGGNNGTNYISSQFIVPNGWYYKSTAFEKWAELR